MGLVGRRSSSTRMLWVSAFLLLGSPLGQAWTTRTLAGRSLKFQLQSSSSSSQQKQEELRRDIENMKREAVQRVKALNERMKELVSEPLPSSTTVLPDSIPTATRPDSLQDEKNEEARQTQALWERRFERDRSVVPATTTSVPLENTQWKVMLNLGREANTWMPKSWGISGERLWLSLQLEFTSQPVSNDDAFLQSNDAHQLHVLNQTLTLAPTTYEGSRTFSVTDGAWKIAPRQGPYETDLLRFYFTVEEEVRHQGSDVYCPVGRVYLTCGYFETIDQESSRKQQLKEEQELLGRRYEQVLQDWNHADWWTKLRRVPEWLEIRIRAGKVSQRLTEARVREPDRTLLRMSYDQKVGLTREGGVCVKVKKGVLTEYHILGKFGLAGMEPTKNEGSHPEQS